MLKLECDDNGNVRVVAKTGEGIAKISFELLMCIKGLVDGVPDEGDKESLEIFIREVLADLVFTDKAGDCVKILVDALERIAGKEEARRYEAEHKQD